LSPVSTGIGIFEQVNCLTM